MLSEMTDSLFQTILKFYDALDSEAADEIVDGYQGEIRVFRGKITDTYRATGASMAYYTDCKRLLTAMKSLVYLRRGNKSVDTCLLLLERPTLERYEQLSAELAEQLTRHPDYATLLRRIETLEEKTGGTAIVEVLRNFEQRITKLEGKVA
jgi:hypothetical protein